MDATPCMKTRCLLRHPVVGARKASGLKMRGNFAEQNKYLEIRVNRKPGDGGWFKIPGSLSSPVYLFASHATGGILHAATGGILRVATGGILHLATGGLSFIVLSRLGRAVNQVASTTLGEPDLRAPRKSSVFPLLYLRTIYLVPPELLSGFLPLSSP